MTAIRPLPPGGLEFDAEGNPIPAVLDGSDLADTIALLEYARAKGFRVGPMLIVGRIRLQVKDLRQREGSERKTEEPDAGIFAEHGFDPNDEHEDE